MITPEYLQDVMDSIEEQASIVDNYLLRHIAERIVGMLEKGNQFFMPSTITELKQLMAKGFSLDEIEKILAEVMPDLQKEIRAAFLNAAEEISRQNIDIAKKIVDIEELASVAVPILEQVGIVQSAEELHMTPVEIRKMERAYKRTNGTIKNITKTLAGTSQQVFIDTCDSAYFKVQAGQSPQKAIIESIGEMCSRGIEFVDYESGRRERMEVAIARAVRTGVNQANGEIVMERCGEMGVQYVLTSAHLGARVTQNDDFTNHSWWQGRVFHLDWDKEELQEYIPEFEDETGRFDWLEKMHDAMIEKHKDDEFSYPDFITSCGFGKMLGIGGINCRHSFYPFTPGVNIIPERPDEKENAKRYALEQKQRSMERAIRKTKRMIEGAKATEDREALSQYSKDLLDQMDVYMKFCDKNGLKPRMTALRTYKNGIQSVGAKEIKGLPENPKQLTKSVKVTDFDDAYNKYSETAKEGEIIDKEIVTKTYESLKENGGLYSFDGVIIGKTKENAPFETLHTQKGNFYDSVLVISNNFFKGLTYNEAEELLKNSKGSVCKNISDCMWHEMAHAKLANTHSMEKYDSYCSQPGYKKISKCAGEDLCEALCEMDVIKKTNRKDVVLTEEMLEKYKEAFE